MWSSAANSLPLVGGVDDAERQTGGVVLWRTGRWLSAPPWSLCDLSLPMKGREG